MVTVEDLWVKGRSLFDHQKAVDRVPKGCSQTNFRGRKATFEIVQNQPQTCLLLSRDSAGNQPKYHITLLQAYNGSARCLLSFLLRKSKFCVLIYLHAAVKLGSACSDQSDILKYLKRTTGLAQHTFLDFFGMVREPSNQINICFMLCSQTELCWHRPQ